MSRLDELERALGAFTPGGPPSSTWFLPELCELLSAGFCGAYRPSATEEGWSLNFMHGAGKKAEDYVELFRGYVSGLAASETFLALGNPHLVPVDQRNRVLTLGDIIRIKDLGDKAEPFDSLFRSLGIVGHDQIRVLICDGPTQLAWIGATRAERFTAREVKALRRLRGPLRERLRLER